MRCPNCGADLRFDPEKQRLICDYCGSDFDPAQFSESDATVSQEQEGFSSAHAEAVQEGTVSPEENPGYETYATYIYTCPQCGGELISEENTAATFCSFCGASTILEGRLSEERKPDYIIPFAKSREDCEAAYQKLLKRSLFAPRYMRAEQTVERFRGIYMPYWIYSFDKDGDVSVQGTTTSRRGDYLITKHYNIEAHVNSRYEGISYDASSSFSDSLSSAIAPYDTTQKTPFEPAYLSGFYADTGDVDAAVYQDNARLMVQADALSKLTSNPAYRKYTISAKGTEMAPDHEKSELGMFPVWFLSCRSGDRISYAVVNGQTGKAAADIPIDFGKYLIGSLILAVPLFVLMNLFLTIRPQPVLILGVILAVISLIISNSQLNRIYAREHGLDDEGLQYAAQKNGGEAPEITVKGSTGETVKTVSANRGIRIAIGVVLIILSLIVLNGAAIPVICLIAGFFFRKDGGGTKVVKTKSAKPAAKMEFGKKLPVLLKPLIGILVAAFVLIWNPVQDLYYYIGAAACMVCVVISFLDIVKDHNRLTLRKLPQFNKRGGDQYV